MSEENKNIRPDPVIRIEVKANRCHIGKTHMAALIAEMVRKQALVPGSGNKLSVKSLDGDFSIIHTAVEGGRQFPPLKNLTFEIVDSHGREEETDYPHSQVVHFTSPSGEPQPETGQEPRTVVEFFQGLLRGKGQNLGLSFAQTELLVETVTSDEQFKRLCGSIDAALFGNQ